MGLEFKREEADKLKEEYKRDKSWVQLLFDKFYRDNWHLPNKLIAMRELLYEETGVKVNKPNDGVTVVNSYHPVLGHSEDKYGSNESKWEENDECNI